MGANRTVRHHFWDRLDELTAERARLFLHSRCAEDAASGDTMTSLLRRCRYRLT